MICTFFGHRTAEWKIQEKLELTIVDLIENKCVDTFYVGNQGKFDYMVIKTLKTLKSVYPHIKYYIVLAYLPSKRNELDFNDLRDTIYPEGLENVPLKYAILKRNEWLISHSDIVVTYVEYSAGGAFRFKKFAERKGKYVINLL